MSEVLDEQARDNHIEVVVATLEADRTALPCRLDLVLDVGRESVTYGVGNDLTKRRDFREHDDGEVCGQPWLPDHRDSEPADDEVASSRCLQRVQTRATERIEAFALHLRRVRRPAMPSATASDGGRGPWMGVTIRITSEVRSASPIAIDCLIDKAHRASKSRFAVRVQSAIGAPPYTVVARSTVISSSEQGRETGRPPTVN